MNLCYENLKVGMGFESRTLKSRADVGLVKFHVTTLNQRGETVQSMVPNLFAPIRAALARAPA